MRARGLAASDGWLAAPDSWPASFAPSGDKWVEKRERRFFTSRSGCIPKWVEGLGHRLEAGLVTLKHCCNLFLGLPALVGDSLDECKGKAVASY